MTLSIVGALMGSHRRPNIRAVPAAVAGLAAGVLLLGACAGEAPAVPDGADAQLVEGRQVWSSACTHCHGTSGGGGRGPSLRASVERFPDVAVQIAVVRDGRDGMPSFGGSLTAVQIEAVVRYVREVL